MVRFLSIHDRKSICKDVLLQRVKAWFPNVGKLEMIKLHASISPKSA